MALGSDLARRPLARTHRLSYLLPSRAQVTDGLRFGLKILDQYIRYDG